MSTAAVGPNRALERGFQALSDGKRLRILAVLHEGERCVCELAEELEVTQPLLSFHLKTLREAGLVRDRREGRWVHYSLDRRAVGELADRLQALAREPATRTDGEGGF